MLSVRLNGELVEVKTETFLGGNEFKHLMQLFEKLGAHHNKGKYMWLIKKEHIDDLVALMGEDKIAWHNSYEDIKGIKETVMPQFEVSDYALDDMLLEPRPFQAIGISFLHDIKQGLLADEMGLGKTPQAIGAIHRLWKEGKCKRALIVCPSSLKYQWVKEIAKFTQHKGIAIDGSPQERKEQLNEFKYGDEYLFAIINYELVRNDLDLIKDIKVDVIAADEVHRIKNWQAKTSQAMKELDAPYKFGLTGTPMQNRPDELYNIFDWMNPKILGNFWAFRNRYIVTGEKFGKKNVVLGYKRLGELRKRVAPYMLRRLKIDVAPELPKMVFNTYRVDMTPEQRRVQDAIQENFMELVQEIQGHDGKGKYNEQGEWIEEPHPKEGQMLGFFNMMLAISDSPELLQMSESHMAQTYAKLLTKTPKSPKLDELVKIAQDQFDAGNKKIVVFTQFARMQQLAIRDLGKLGGCEMINGTMNSLQRDQALENFEHNDDINFLVCTDAANYGLNMQFANVLINIDIPWNPATYDQRAGRVHRIGGEHEVVNIIDIITSGGIDEKIEEALYRKRELAGQIVEKNDEERAEMRKLTANFLSTLMTKKKKKRK